MDAMEQRAQAAGLNYVRPGAPGYTRRRAGRGFAYYRPDGSLVPRLSAERSRLQSLAIPPAWKDVWIALDEDAHLQATGRDGAGRKQYIYHPRWSELAQQQIFDQLPRFAELLPRLRRQVARDLRRRGLPKERVLAGIIALIDTTLIRVGNEESAAQDKAYGATTLLGSHVVDHHGLKLCFIAKGGKPHEVRVRDRRLKRLIRQCRGADDERLFRYQTPQGERVAVTCDDVNEYLSRHCGQGVTAKNFRTWGGTARFAEFVVQNLSEFNCTEDLLRQAEDAVSRKLNNTPAVARSHYIHSLLPQCLRDGRLRRVLQRARERSRSFSHGEELVRSLLLGSASAAS